MVGVVGLTHEDLYAEGANFNVGSAHRGKRTGVVSNHRFGAPGDAKLRSRVLKQLLSTVGLVLGVPRCEEPRRARVPQHHRGARRQTRAAVRHLRGADPGGALALSQRGRRTATPAIRGSCE